MKKKQLFCDIHPAFYAISAQKEICRRHLKDLFSGERFAKIKSERVLPCLIHSHSSNMIKRGRDIDPILQANKAVNIALAGKRLNGLLIRPGETFSFYKTVGKATRRRGYREGRFIRGNRLVSGMGGGLCNLGNTIHLLVLHSPLDVTEVHFHSDALAPDEGKRVPFSSGTSVCYNYIDFRCKNNTDQQFQLMVWCENDRLYAELRSEREVDCSYSLAEEDHHFRKENGKYYRISRIYRQTTDRETGELVKKELIRDNHSEVMYDYEMIPKAQIRQ